MCHRKLFPGRSFNPWPIVSCVVPHLIQTRTLYHGKSKGESYPEPPTKRQGRRILFDVTDQPSAVGTRKNRRLTDEVNNAGKEQMNAKPTSRRKCVDWRGSVHMDEKAIVNLGKILCPDE